MAKKSVGGTGKGVIGGQGVQATPARSTYGGKLQRGGKGLIGGYGVQGTPTAKNYGGVLGRSKAAPKASAKPSRTLVGGLGMQAFGTSARKAIETRTPKNATTATRNYQYGNVMASAPIKTQVKPNDVVRTSTPMKVSPTREKGGGGGMFGGSKSSTPQRGTNLGVSSGKTTGKTTTRSGTGGRTTGGGRSTGGGYSNAGPAGMGASGRGTGGKR